VVPAIGLNETRRMSESELESIRHYRRLGPMLASAGQPDPDQLALLQPAFDCVIKLARPDSPHALDNEADLVNRLGLDYVHIPVDFSNPLPADLEEFLAAMRAHASERLFVHCALNWRASAFVFLHRVINEQWDPAQARADMLAVWQPDATWQIFIDSMLSRHGDNNNPAE